MINAILKGLLGFVVQLFAILLYPIDSYITTNLPAFDNVLTSFGNFINQVLGFFPWILSWFNIPLALLTFVVGYYSFKLVASATFRLGKIIVAWWHRLIP